MNNAELERQKRRAKKEEFSRQIEIENEIKKMQKEINEEKMREHDAKFKIFQPGEDEYVEQQTFISIFQTFVDVITKKIPKIPRMSEEFMIIYHEIEQYVATVITNIYGLTPSKCGKITEPKYFSSAIRVVKNRTNCQHVDRFYLHNKYIEWSMRHSKF